MAIEMATLVGTEKQVKWASDIRNEFFADSEGVVGNAGIVLAFQSAWKNRDEVPVIASLSFDEYKPVGMAAIKTLLAETDAAFWIENRDEYKPAVVGKVINSLRVVSA